MLTSEKLATVTWALDKLDDARAALERLRSEEPSTLPADMPGGKRYTAVAGLAHDVARISRELEALYS